MRTQQFATALLVAAIALAGCKKDEPGASSPAPSVPAVNAMRALFHGHVDDAKQTFSVSASAGGYVNGASGIGIYFAPNAFRTMSGSAVSGMVQVELVEALTLGQMLWLNKQTLGNDNGQMALLRSGGQYYLNATQSGEPLKLAENAGQVYVPAPNGTDPTMSLFSGELASDGTIVWNPFDNTLPLGQDSTGYGFPNDSLGWVNIDVFMGLGAQTTLQVTCPDGHDDSNTLMWLVFQDQNSIACMPASSSNVFSLGSYYTVPVGLNIKIVALSNIGGTYSSSVTDAMVAPGLNQVITFSPTTLSEFEAMVMAL